VAIIVAIPVVRIGILIVLDLTLDLRIYRATITIGLLPTTLLDIRLF
jgi:hypothetical protein